MEPVAKADEAQEINKHDFFSRLNLGTRNAPIVNTDDQVNSQSLITDKETKHTSKVEPVDKYDFLLKLKLHHCGTIIVCPREQVNPRFVATILGRYDHNVGVTHHWVSENASSTSKVWAGAVAQFSSISFGRKTTEELRKYSESLKIISFNEWVDILKTAEELHPKQEKQTTKILMRAHGRFDSTNVLKLIDKLSPFGKYKGIFTQYYEESGSIGEVEYDTQLQAYAAKTVINRMRFSHLGHLIAHIEQSESGKQFDDFVRKRFRELLHRD